MVDPVLKLKVQGSGFKVGVGFFELRRALRKPFRRFVIA
jgi:hypothetical protein